MTRQYSKHLSIQQISDTEFLLRVTDSKLAEELEQLLPSIFGRYIAKRKSINNDEVQFNISEMDLTTFDRHLNTLTPELLESLSSH